MTTLWQDVRYGLRMLARNPGFTAGVVLILAVGIGANTAIFSVVNATLLRPLPYVHPEQLVQVKKDLIKDSKREISESATDAQLLAWQKESRTFAGLAGYNRTESTLIGGERAERVQCGKVTAGFFSVLGVQMPLGRAFLPEEDQVGAAPAAILSHDLWRRCFDADPAVIGKTILLDDRSYTFVALAGVGAGLLASLWLTRYLASMLYAVKPADPLTFVAVAVLLIGVAAAACILPAWRAARVDPMTALRND